MYENEIIQLIRKAHTSLPSDVFEAIKKAAYSEKNLLPKQQLENILQNVEIAKNDCIPMCQDTGMNVFFVKGKQYPDIDFRSALLKAEKEIPLRKSLVAPLSRDTRETEPIIHFEKSNSDYLEISYLAKGGGSENMAQQRMLNPLEGIADLTSFIVEAMEKANSSACPPNIIGIGIGSTLEQSALFAEKALLKPINENTKFEEELLEEVNNTGIGPSGLGGKYTSLGVNLVSGNVHTASLPVTVNISCWALRRATLLIRGGDIEWK